MASRHLWQAAAAFAARAHQHQTRKDGQTPYFSHPARVTLTIACVFGFQDEKVLAAALLHDTIEDTNVDYDDIHKEFGREVADFVAAMTKDMRLIESQREIAYDKQLAAGPWQSRLIKLADVYDNMLDPIADKPVRKILEKAHRALKLTANDKQLVEARRMVQQVVGEIERQP